MIVLNTVIDQYRTLYSNTFYFIMFVLQNPQMEFFEKFMQSTICWVIWNKSEEIFENCVK